MAFSLGKMHPLVLYHATFLNRMIRKVILNLIFEKLDVLFSTNYMTLKRFFIWQATLHWTMGFIYNMIFINPFVPNASFLYPLKTSENRKVKGWIVKDALGTNWLKRVFHTSTILVSAFSNESYKYEFTPFKLWTGMGKETR